MATSSIDFDALTLALPERPRCAHPGCTTRLNRYNQDMLCCAHRRESTRTRILSEATAPRFDAEARICAVLGCTRVLGENNRRGRCTAHSYAFVGMRLKDGTELHPAAPRVACAVAECTRTLGATNVTGLCLFHKSLRERTHPGMTRSELVLATMFARWESDPLGKARVQ